MLSSVSQVTGKQKRAPEPDVSADMSLHEPWDHSELATDAHHEEVPTTGPCNGWLSREAFAQILRKERHRTDRTGSPFSLLLFELCEGLGQNDLHGAVKQAIALHTRDYDIRVLFGPHRLGVLLLDTPLSTARVLAAKMLARLRERNNGADPALCLRAVQMYTYPASCAGGYERLEMVLPHGQNFDQGSVRGGMCHQGTSIPALPGAPIIWNVSCEPLGAAVASTPLFLDLARCSDVGYRVAKRALDIVAAVVGMVVTAPLWLLIALLVKLNSKGPVLFRQERVGYQGKHFTMFKFRTMRVGCDDAVHRDYVKKLIEGRTTEVNLGTEEKPVYKLVDDPRVTRVGHFLRRTSLDELPQLINVLLGQMSLVGPRPPLPFEVESYKSWHLRRILEAKPGITGLWQVYGRSSTTFDEMVRMDLRYAAQRSFWLDLKLILKTFAAVFAARGAH
ncbi:MAG: sugar transferase [candidate division KSB1 bacterium]|nr:sugar transferase [candidate division KSB1 bacterium]